jgi:NADH-quinone oxidoreductase subunit L
VFKAGLFLGAGSVMHGMNDEVEHAALRCPAQGHGHHHRRPSSSGYLAIIGIPPFSGFWSKDEIIHAAFEKGPVIGALLVLAAGITGFYMSRMVVDDLLRQGALGGRRPSGTSRSRS